MDRICNVLAVAVALYLSPSVFAQVPNIQFDSDVSASLKTQVLADIDWISTVHGVRSTPLHQRIFGAIDGANYMQWLGSRVYYFGVDRCGGGNAVACVKSKYDNKMFVTNQYIRGNYPQVARLMTIYHEARHTEKQNGMWAHAKCPSNFPYRSIWTGARLAGNRSCDGSELGSYASASILMDNISKFCENCTDKARADARLYADDQMKRVVGAVPIQRIQADFNVRE
ncbi:MAG: hypothetical protein JST80_05110 [Bdellovibrionales bacterium]|nr:hypothetical protein [Bdellovibrionales bacterium]